MEPYLRSAHYYETDQMGIVHHSNYIRWFEEARIDFMDQLGMGYARMEEAGIYSPVLDVSCTYKHPVRFDERVQIRIRVEEYNGIKLRLAYEITRLTDGSVCTLGTSGHCFLSKEGRPLSLKRAHPAFHEMFQKAMEEQ